MVPKRCCGIRVLASALQGTVVDEVYCETFKVAALRVTSWGGKRGFYNGAAAVILNGGGKFGGFHVERIYQYGSANAARC